MPKNKVALHSTRKLLQYCQLPEKIPATFRQIFVIIARNLKKCFLFVFIILFSAELRLENACLGFGASCIPSAFSCYSVKYLAANVLQNPL
jgi:hypothetical protein